MGEGILCFVLAASGGGGCLVIKAIGLMLVCLVGCAAVSKHATAQTATFAVETGVSTISPCPSFCGGSGGAFDSDIDVGVGLTTSMSSLNNADGMGNAQAELLGPGELPILKAEAYSHVEALPQRSSRVAAQAFGLQGFYVSDSSISLDVTLSGIANDVPNVAAVFNEDASLTAHVMIIRDNDPSSEISFTSHYPTMKFENIPGSPDLELLADAVTGSGAASLVIPPDNTVHSVSTTLTAAGLNYGDLIYVWAEVSASGTRGGFADGFDTLTMQFQGSPMLSHDPLPPVPEPATGWLMVGGLLLTQLATRDRRQRSHPNAVAPDQPAASRRRPS